MSFVTAKAEAQPPILYILHHYGTTSKKDARTATLSFPVPMGATTPDAAPLGYCWVGNWKLGRKEYGTSFTTLLTGVRPPSIRKVRYKKKYNDNATRTLTYRLCTNNGLNVNAEIKGWEREIREEVYGEGVSLVVKARAEYYLDVLAMILKTYNGMGTLSSRKGGWLKFFEGEGVGEAEVWEMLGTSRGLNLVGGGENLGGGDGGREKSCSVDSILAGQIHSQLKLVPKEEQLEALILEREKGIKEINKDMLTVNKAFNDVAKLVNDQQEFVDDIESKAEDTHEKTKRGLSDLQEARKIQKGCAVM
ncbi:hypothetical protein TrST_g337 [Triparma strigata]|uniref:t-SNARE coiled-coil homology domain-containing protein n=1 Tax=Triparma strigata TaxID=1606541 RepID=A0A9W7AQS5_9STRA|nr:hypothetical protein TrST_g337 [Triparma strigata]